jgi:hypothetical protein
MSDIAAFLKLLRFAEARQKGLTANKQKSAQSPTTTTMIRMAFSLNNNNERTRRT